MQKKSLEFAVVGCGYEDAIEGSKALVRYLVAAETAVVDLELVEEPDNPHDPNAIKVMFGEDRVGYVKRADILSVVENFKRVRASKKLITYMKFNNDFEDAPTDNSDLAYFVVRCVE